MRLELPQDKELHHDRLNEFVKSNHGLLVRDLTNASYELANKANS